MLYPSRKSVCKNAQPQNLFLRSYSGAWGSASTSSESVCIDTGIACEYYTGFSITQKSRSLVLCRNNGIAYKWKEDDTEFHTNKDRIYEKMEVIPLDRRMDERAV